ncbi:NADH-quinone oxidoreductase subunit B family protein [Nautilia sp.]
MNLYWLQSGGCGGDTMSFLNCECNLYELFEQLNINVIWHPSLSNLSCLQHIEKIERILKEDIRLDILCVEGNVVLGPEGTGMFNTFMGKQKKDLIHKLAHKAEYVIAVGTCASFGGFGSENELQGVGLQFKQEQKGGFLGKHFISKSGLPVINLPGCPIHPKALAVLLEEIANGLQIKLTENQAPEEIYTFTVHQGCTRNEYHEYKVEEHKFGERGCMFFHLGCKGPTTNAACNKYLWNEVNSKTRAGVPCFGCARPDFPQDYPFFKTPNIVGTPAELPKGVDRAHYLAYKDMAAAAAPKRLKERKQRV